LVFADLSKSNGARFVAAGLFNVAYEVVALALVCPSALSSSLVDDGYLPYQFLYSAAGLLF